MKTKNLQFVDFKRITFLLIVFNCLLLTSCTNTYQVHRSSKKNPNLFPFSNTHLPLNKNHCHRVIAGVKKISREEIINLFDSILIVANLDIEKDVILSFDDINITVNSYNKQHKIGYIWIGWSNYGKGLVTPGEYQFRNLKAIQEQLKENIQDHYLSYKKDSISFFKNRFYAYLNPIKNVFKQDLRENFPQYATPINQAAFFYRKYEKYTLAAYLQRLEIDKISSPLSIWQKEVPNRIQDKTTAFALLLGVSSPLHNYFKYGSSATKRILNAEIQAINDTKNNQVWKNRSEALLDILNVNLGPTAKRNLNYHTSLSTIIHKYAWNKRKKYFKTLTHCIDINQISLKEVQRIEKANLNGDYHIALVSSRDNRLFYTPVDNPEIAENLTWYIKLAKNQIKKDSLTTVLKLLNEESYVDKLKRFKASAIKKLATDFKAYIHLGTVKK